MPPEPVVFGELVQPFPIIRLPSAHPHGGHTQGGHTQGGHTHGGHTHGGHTHVHMYACMYGVGMFVH